MTSDVILPEWLKIRYLENDHSKHISGLMAKHKLHSVCQSAHCPNRNECWAHGTATFMVMGEYCTRACRFCAVKTLAKPPPLDPEEPKKLAEAVQSLNLRYLVLTSVTRDDLEDGGAGHIAECVRQLKEKIPNLMVEVLVPDFRANEKAIQTIIGAQPDVVSHNIETVERLTPQVRDRRASYAQSLKVIQLYKGLSGGKLTTKSGIMVGLGEKEAEVLEAMKDLRGVGVEILTIGQYLQPTKTPRHLPVIEFVHPDQFAVYKKMGYELRFKYVASGPFVRSSYRAAEAFILQSRLQ
jgi:lipoic acid synthetase